MQYQNFTPFAEPGDSILILYGQGHMHIFNELFEDASDFEVVDVNQYLAR